MPQGQTFLGEMRGGRGGGSEVRDMTLPSLRNLGAKCSENVIPSFEDLFYANRPLLSLDINLKMFDSSIFFFGP